MGRGPRPDWIQEWLRDWAQWRQGISGYSNNTVIARVMAGHTGPDRKYGKFQSDIPKGVEVPAHLRRLDIVMGNCLADKKLAKYVMAARVYHEFGKEEVERILGRPERTVTRWCRRGEDILRNELRK